MLLVWSSPTATWASGEPCATSTPRRKSSVAGITASSNILAKVPKREQPPALLILRQIPYAESRQEAERLKRVFQEWVPPQRLGSGGRICWTRTGIGW